ncbi:MAG: 30S ribosomal protein S4 [Patescibacteria group bacterium]|nr:30S ribosomal protein S4 [bacterium]MDZ4240555.1 30S ribosomal protein S4 [Patescibacteria group bacterium]
MKIGPKYKIARRLKAPVFEKTQTQKYVLSEAKKTKVEKRRGAMSDYGRQLIEKQKARYTYLLSERQFSKYVAEAMNRKGMKNADALYENLERRLDNAIFRLGYAPSRPMARQLVSHGHIQVNGVRVTRPSYQMKINDKIKIRELSLAKPLFAKLDERLQGINAPIWFKSDTAKKEADIVSLPKRDGADMLFDLNSVLEFYSR